MKALERASLFIGAPLGNLEGVSLTAGSVRQVREGSENRTSFSMGALRGEPGEGSSTADPELWRRTSLSIGAPLGNLQERFFYRGIRTVKEGSGKGTSLCMGALRGNLQGRLWKREFFSKRTPLGEGGRKGRLFCLGL